MNSNIFYPSHREYSQSEIRILYYYTVIMTIMHLLLLLVWPHIFFHNEEEYNRNNKQISSWLKIKINQWYTTNKTMTTKITDLMLAQSPYFFALYIHGVRTCWLGAPQRLTRCLSPGPPTTNWGCHPVYVHTEHQDQSLYQLFHPLPSQNCHHSCRLYFALSTFEKLGSLHMLYMEIKLT